MKLPAALAVVTVGVAGFAGSAKALETGQCLPAAQVRATLAAEGQSTIMLGNRSGFGYPTTLAFTSNSDGSKGYAIRGDRKLGEQAAIICIDSEFRDIRLNDVTKPGVPKWAQIPVLDVARVAEICAPQKLGYQGECGTVASSLVSQDEHGQRLLFMATGTAVNPQDDSVRKEQKIIVTFSSKNQGGLVEAVTPEGAAYMLAAYSSVTVTPQFEALRKLRP